MLALTTGIPESQAPRRRPRRRWRIRRQAQTSTPRESSRRARHAARTSRSAGPRPRSEAAPGRAPRPRPDPGHRARGRRQDGKLLGLNVDLLADMGAYLQLVDAGRSVAGRVHVQRASTTSRRTRSAARTVFTTKTPTDAYRGAGRPEATFGDRADHGRARPPSWASDPMEIRRQELDHPRGVPVHHVCRADLRLAATTRRRTAQGVELVRVRRAARRAGGSGAAGGNPVQLGIGISTFTEMCGLAPSRVLGSLELLRRRLGARRRSGSCPPARSQVVTGATPHGQGHETSWSQIVADRLGIPFEDVEVLHGDTAISARGHGHLRLPLAGRRRDGDRATPRTRSSTRPAGSRRTLLEADEDDLDFTAGTFSVKGSPDQAMAHRGRRVRGLRGAQPARTAWSRRSSSGHLRPGRTSPSRTAPTCARSRSTPRRGSEDP